MVEFGLRLPVGGPLAHVDHIERAARGAEALGFDSVWVHDFIGWSKRMDRTHISCGARELVQDDTTPLMYEMLTTLSFVAGITERIRIGAAILCAPYRNPVIQAKQVACIDQLSRGRLILGVGVGALGRIGSDFEVVGVPRSSKYERTREYLRLMRTIWEDPLPQFDGEFVALPETELNPKPVQRPLPVWMGGKGEKALSIMVESANGWIPTWLTAADYRERVPVVRERLQAEGRDPESFVIAKECYVAIDESDAEARRQSRATFESFTEGFTVETYEDAIASALLGDPETIAEQVAEYVESGVDHFEMKFIYHSEAHLEEQMELFARSILQSSVGEVVS